MTDNQLSIQQNQFNEVLMMIEHHRSCASQQVNKEILLTAWNVGGYVSAKLKSEEWGSKVVTLLSEYIRTQHPGIKGYSRSSIYNMVMFYDEYSSLSFQQVLMQYMPNLFLNTPEWLDVDAKEETGKSISSEIVQTAFGQFPELLCLTTLSNHFEILCKCNNLIGIILCPEADRVVVEYAMSRTMSPTMIAEYKRILIPQERLQQQLKEFCQFFLSENDEKSCE